MIELVRPMISNQYEAALATLHACIDQCSDGQWEAPVGKWDFCQVVLHTLFYTDLYLDHGEESFQQQEFHQQHRDFFGDYHQFEEHDPAAINARAPTLAYLQHCRTKARAVMAEETAATLAEESAYDWITCNRGEQHVRNIRHIQHHGAQLSLRLQLDGGTAVRWFSTGWSEP